MIREVKRASSSRQARPSLGQVDRRSAAGSRMSSLDGTARNNTRPPARSSATSLAEPAAALDPGKELGLGFAHPREQSGDRRVRIGERQIFGRAGRDRTGGPGPARPAAPVGRSARPAPPASASRTVTRRVPGSRRLTRGVPITPATPRARRASGARYRRRCWRRAGMASAPRHRGGRQVPRPHQLDPPDREERERLEQAEAAHRSRTSRSAAAPA